MAAVDTRPTDLVLQGRIERRSDVEVYEVQGFSGRDYFVMVRDGDTIGCTCPASKFDHDTCYVKEGVKGYLQMQAVLDFENDEVEYGL